MDSDQLARSLANTLANPYSLSYPTPHYPRHHVNTQGYAFSSTYNPLAHPSSYLSTPYPSPAPSSGILPSTSGSRNALPRGAPPTHWYTAGNSKCTHPGCTFTGSANSMQIHMMDRHLIYPQEWHIRKRQKDWDADPSLKGKPVPILGTNVRLDTPEEIAAWVAERKRRWPTAARVAEKKRKLEEAMANGVLHPEHLALTGRNGYNNYNKRPRLPPPPSDAGADALSGGSRRGRGRANFGARGRGRGRGDRGFRNRGFGTSGVRGDINGIASTLPSPSPVSTSTESTEPQQSPPLLARAVVASYPSSDDDDDDDAPEVMSAKQPSGNEVYESPLDAEPEQQPQAVNDHDHSQPRITVSSSRVSGSAGAAAGPPSTPTRAESVDHPRRTRPPQPKEPPRNPFAARSSLLRNLLLPEIRVTVSNLSQAIRFLVDNDFLENVELKPGEADEKRIEVVGEQPAEPETEMTTLGHAEPLHPI